MSGSNSNRILSIYRSRDTLLKFMEKLNYNTLEYKEFSINEVDAMFANSQLDMLLTNTSDNKKVYIKYYFTSKTVSKQIRPNNLDTIIEDLYDIENVLSKDDTLIIVIDEEPNDSIITKVKYLYEKDGVFVVIHNIKRLQFNILNHSLVPYVEILPENAVEELKKTMNIKDVKQLPEVSRFDPVSLAIALRPGQVVKYVRGSQTALKTDYYRVCV
jgi:DNA-directed RNA polymerase subunit H (RpoH/RPB5)